VLLPLRLPPSGASEGELMNAEEEKGDIQLLTRLPNNRLETDFRTCSLCSPASAAQP
jgi:hypothetical protein